MSQDSQPNSSTSLQTSSGSQLTQLQQDGINSLTQVLEEKRNDVGFALTPNTSLFLDRLHSAILNLQATIVKLKSLSKTVYFHKANHPDGLRISLIFRVDGAVNVKTLDSYTSDDYINADAILISSTTGVASALERLEENCTRVDNVSIELIGSNPQVPTSIHFASGKKYYFCYPTSILECMYLHRASSVRLGSPAPATQVEEEEEEEEEEEVDTSQVKKEASQVKKEHD